jgi:hypothetical protein
VLICLAGYTELFFKKGAKNLATSRHATLEYWPLPDFQESIL